MWEERQVFESVILIRFKAVLGVFNLPLTLDVTVMW